MPKVRKLAHAHQLAPAELAIAEHQRAPVSSIAAGVKVASKHRQATEAKMRACFAAEDSSSWLFKQPVGIQKKPHAREPAASISGRMRQPRTFAQRAQAMRVHALDVDSPCGGYTVISPHLYAILQGQAHELITEGRRPFHPRASLDIQGSEVPQHDEPVPSHLAVLQAASQQIESGMPSDWQPRVEILASIPFSSPAAELQAINTFLADLGSTSGDWDAQAAFRKFAGHAAIQGSPSSPKQTGRMGAPKAPVATSPQLPQPQTPSAAQGHVLSAEEAMELDAVNIDTLLFEHTAADQALVEEAEPLYEARAHQRHRTFTGLSGAPSAQPPAACPGDGHHSRAVAKAPSRGVQKLRKADVQRHLRYSPAAARAELARRGRLSTDLLPCPTSWLSRKPHSPRQCQPRHPAHLDLGD